MVREKRPFNVVLEGLMEERELSAQRLGRMTREDDRKGVSHPHISAILRGVDHPTIRVMESVARALHVDPEMFAEYRMDMWRARLDHRNVPFDDAIKTLDQIEA